MILAFDSQKAEMYAALESCDSGNSDFSQTSIHLKIFNLYVKFTNFKVCLCAVYVFEISKPISILCGIREKD